MENSDRFPGRVELERTVAAYRVAQRLLALKSRSPHHTAPGTLTLPPRLYRKLLEESRGLEKRVVKRLGG